MQERSGIAGERVTTGAVSRIPATAGHRDKTEALPYYAATDTVRRNTEAPMIASEYIGCSRTEGQPALKNTGALPHHPRGERTMQTTLTDWSRMRADLLAEDHASAAMIRGYLDAANGRPLDLDLFVGMPFEADDYHAGFYLARYEIGPVTGEEIAA